MNKGCQNKIIRILLRLSVVVSLGCATSQPKTKVIYGLSESDLQAIGRDLGFTVEDRGGLTPEVGHNRNVVLLG